MTDCDKILLDWEAQGFTGAFCHMYTSDWEKSDELLFESIINALNFQFAILLVNHDKELIFESQAWHSKFHKSWRLAVIPTKRFLLGQYLQIYVPFVNEERESARSAHTAVTAIIRLVAQPGIARELVAEGEFSFSETRRTWVTAGSTGKAILVERQGLWLSSEKIMQLFGHNHEVHINRKAARLIELAMEQEEPFLKFIILWSALEALLGDGKMRKKYFNECFGGEVCEAVKNLHILRSDILHSEDFRESVTEAKISLMLEVIRAATLRSDAIRKVISERLQTICRHFNQGTLPETLDIHSTSLVIAPLGRS